MSNEVIAEHYRYLKELRHNLFNGALDRDITDKCCYSQNKSIIDGCIKNLEILMHDNNIRIRINNEDHNKWILIDGYAKQGLIISLSVDDMGLNPARGYWIEGNIYGEGSWMGVSGRMIGFKPKFYLKAGK